MIRSRVYVTTRGQLPNYLWSLFKTLFIAPEPIEVLEQRFNFFPRTFRWRGDVCRIRSVTYVWDHGPRWGSAPRRYFRVTGHRGERYTLFQNLHIGTWHIDIGGV